VDRGVDGEKYALSRETSEKGVMFLAFSGTADEFGLWANGQNPVPLAPLIEVTSWLN
jgi:hypothetical protein